MPGGITQTSELAVSILLSLALRGRNAAVTPREIAEDIGASPTYAARVCGELVRNGILRSQRGAQGGVVLERSPERLTLLEVVEASQGRLLGEFCNEVGDGKGVCGYHIAMHELYGQMSKVLRRWTLADLLKQPAPELPPSTDGHCLISRTWNAALKDKAPRPKE